MAVIANRAVRGGRGYDADAADDLASGASGAGVGQREDLANFISMITRDETPFMSSIGKTKATAIYHEWQTDELSAPGNSRIGEGTDYIVPDTALPLANGAFDTGTDIGQYQNPAQLGTDVGGAFAITGPNRTRLGNYCQINGKTIAISGTRRAVDTAGVADEYAYQLKKRGTELRRDIEFDLVHNYNASNNTGNTRTAGGYQAWINDTATVEVAADTAANVLPVAANQGLGNETVTLTATKGALSLTDIDQVMQKIYQEGGKANRIMVSPKLRRDFSDLMVTDSGVRRNLDEKGKLRQSVDVYMSDFGDLMVVPNYIMGLSNTPAADGADGNTNNPGRAAVQTQDSCALIYDPMWWSVATLRPLQELDIGQRGDSTTGMMVEEFTLECKNPLGCGAIYNLE